MDDVVVESGDVKTIQQKASKNGEEFLVTIEGSEEFWIEMFAASFFLFPERHFLLIPNPKKRFCVDLHAPPKSASIATKLKRYTSTFEPVVSEDIRESLTLCARYHSERKRSTWLLPIFIDCLASIKSDKVKFYSFELRDDKQILAVSVGYSCGGNFHDVTAATFVRDKRSLGLLLLELQRQKLLAAGYELWYLGFKLDYMGNFEGFEFDRKTFFEKWNQAAMLTTTMVPTS